MKKFQQPPIITTDDQRKKFTTLVIMAGIVIVLFWVLLFPWSYRPDENAPAGPKEFFQAIGNEISEGSHMVPTSMNPATPSESPKLNK
ncbi:MAG TPA: hypothetical protein VJB65_00570 [Patescibacteria group bacterium]|nr:hypothetical protein [Patescibacteria group bacterium]